MIDWTDRHCRYFHRQFSPHAALYTEMITATAILYGNQERLLGFDKAEHPVVLQLGGSDPSQLAAAAKIGSSWGYDQINLNCGCPSDRVQQGKFGACLMAEPKLVANCIKAIQDATSAPVTVKCRIGIDNANPDVMLPDFIRSLIEAGCTTFIVHARKAWLKGLSPKENREIPPLNYELPARIKRELGVTIIINGGITSTSQALEHLKVFDGIMIGREAYHNPWFIADMEHILYQTPRPNPRDILETMCDYMMAQISRSGTPIKSVTRHMLGMFGGISGAKKWRRTLGEEASKATDPRDFIFPLFEEIESLRQGLTPAVRQSDNNL